jgi:DoxX-like family
MSIYVEILIRSGMDDLWEKTQDPKLHQRWDLRFSEIDYLPRKPGEAQKFLYKTRIGGGLRIEGAGESMGERDDASGQRTSALKFWSDDPKSLIRIGSGYWKYIPGNNGVRFITWYNYRTRFGLIGQIVDKLFFRPLLGWATAWSFDRLRLWIEKGVLPEVSRDRTFVYTLSRLTVAFVWLYHGLIPKLIYRNPDELSMLRDAGIPDSHLPAVMSSLGIIEVCLSLVLVVFWNSRWPLWFTLVAMVSAVLAVGITSPGFLTAAFNPMTLNLAVAVLAVVGLLTGTGLPAASNCHRKSPEG